MKRLASPPTLRVNLQSEVPFTCGGKRFTGLQGDTIATALFAAGVRIFGRSLKYHRPRGLYSLDGESGNTMMTVDGVPNVCTETTLLQNGASVREQNVFFSARYDLAGILDHLDRLMPAGFYYKRMHKPAVLWPYAMKMIRRAAGLGRIRPDAAFPGEFDEIYPAADVCVIGGGPSGMHAALHAADKDLRVVLLEARHRLGGCYDYRTIVSHENLPLYRHASELAARVTQHPNIRLFLHTSMVGGYADNLITAVQQGGTADAFDQRYIEIRAKSVVAATGSRERPLLFEHNERPGVMQAACAHRLAMTYGILPGKRAVFSVGCDYGLEAAVDLHDLGLPVAAVADIRDDGRDPGLVSAVRKRDIPYFPGWVACRAIGSKGVRAVELCTCEGTVFRRFACDVLVASAGKTPVSEPLCLLQAGLAYDARTHCFLPVSFPDGVFAAGRVLGLESPASIAASGRLAGLSAASFCGRPCRDEADAAQKDLEQLPVPPYGARRITAPVSGRKSFVCFDEDATVKHVIQSIEEGLDLPEFIKRYTGAGTGPGQGGIPGHNLPLLAARIRGESFENTAPTTVRPPLAPVFMAAYAGVHREMIKQTPIHDIQAQRGGIYRRAGAWQRARYFSADLDPAGEVDNVRTNVGLLDASTLGNFRIFGPDALKALQRVYVGDMSKIAAGRIKYSAMCNHDGCVIDDGVVIQTGENDYAFTTSTGRAGATAEWIRYHTRFENWNFSLVNMTDGIATINLAGPNAGKVLEKVTDADVSGKSFGFGRWFDFYLDGTVPARSMRLGFVGELSYEIQVPASYAHAVWEMLESAGSEFGIRPFGVEAQNVLRMEKGHVILGQESEQRTNLLDLGLGFLWAPNKSGPTPVGAEALARSREDPGRLKLAGIEMEDSSRVPGDGSIIVDAPEGGRVIGYIPTIRLSRSVGAVIGMALVEAPWSAAGTRLSVYEAGCGGRLRYATVRRMPFYDPHGKRMKI